MKGKILTEIKMKTVSDLYYAYLGRN